MNFDCINKLERLRELFYSNRVRACHSEDHEHDGYFSLFKGQIADTSMADLNI